MKSPPAKLVLTCTGSIADADLQERLHRIKTQLQYLSQSDGNSVNLSKVEPWNSVRVTFNIPPEAAARLRELAQRGDPNLHKLGILTVQVENGETISLPPPPAENQHSLFSPPPPTPTEIAQLPLGPPLVPPSPAPVVSPPVIPVSTPGLVIQGHGPGQGPSHSFQMPGPSLQQLTRPSFLGLQSQGPTVPPPFGQQGPGNLWNPMGVSQQRPLQPPPGNFWNQIPQFFPQVNMSQPNNQQQGMVGGPPMPPAPQPKPQPKKRRKRTKKANIQPPDLAVAAGQPLLPLPPHLQNLPPSNTNIQDASDNLNTNKPSNLSLPPGLIDNPISPNTPPTTALSTSSAIPAPIVGSSSNAGNQFSFTDIPISRGLVPSPQTQQQLLQKRTDVTLTSPLLVNLLQSDISAKQFPFTNTTGSKMGTETLTPGMFGPGGQEMVQASTALGNTGSPFMLGNGLGTIVHPNSAIANMHPFATSQGSALGHPSPSGHFLPSNAFLQAQSGQLSQEQIQFQLSQLSAVQHSQAQGPHGQPFPGNMPQGMPCQNQMQPGPNQMQLGHMQPFPGGHHMQGPTFPGLIPHSQLPDARMSIGPATLHNQVPQGQITLGRPMLMGHMPSRQVSHPLPIDRSLSQGKDKSQPAKQSPPVSLSVQSRSSIPSVDPTNTPIADKSAMCMDYQSNESTTPSNSDSAVIQQRAPSEKNGNYREKQVEKQPQESQVFDEETALLGMTEAERDTMAMAAIIAKEAKMAADAKNGKPAQEKDASTTNTESQHSLQMPQSFTAVPCSDGDSVSSRASTSTPITSSMGTFSGSQPNEPSSKAAPPAPPVAERRPSNSPIRLSPPQMPESIKQRRTPPASAPKQIHHQPPHYGPILGNPLSSMASGIAGLQTLTSRTFSTAAQPSIRDMALSRNPEHNTLSQFLRSVTPPSEILQMAPLFRSSKQQEMKPKPTSGFQPCPTSASSEWLSLPNVDTQKPLQLPTHVGTRTPMQPAEFSAATEEMLGSMLDIKKPDLSIIERPPNQPRVITTEGINFMQKLVGRAHPSVPPDQAPQKESESKVDQREQTNPADQVRKEDKSHLKALLNEIVTEKCPFEKQFGANDSKSEKHHPIIGSLDSVSLERQPSTLSSVTPHQAEQWFGFPTMSLTQTTTKNMDSLPKSGNITSIYIPPSGQQQQQTFNQPLSSAQWTTVTATHTTAAPVLDDTHCRNTVIQAGTEVAGQNLSDQMEPLKHFSVASPSVNPSQPVSFMQQVLGSEVADAALIRNPQEIDPSHSRGFKVELPGAKTSSSSNQQCQVFTKNLTPTSPSVTQHHLSLQETPMTVLERVPPILMSPATFSTASQELMRTLGAHGPLAGLIPGSEQVPPAPQQMQNFPAKIDQLHAEIDAPGTASLKQLSSVASFMSHFQPRVPKMDISSLPTINLQGEQQLQQAINESKDVQATDSLKGPHISIVPATTSESTSVSQTSMLPPLPPVQLSGEYSSKMPPSQFLATSNVPHQSPEIQPEILSERVPMSHESVQAKEGKPVSHDLPSPKEVFQFTEPDVNRPASVHPQEATLLPELGARTTSENTKQLEAIPQTSVSYETEKTTQPMYKKISVDRHVTQQQQQLRTSASLAAFGFPPVPPSTNTSPVKPSAYPSASSTLAQAQSIMVKTGAMSRTAGIIKGTEQASRPVRSRTPPRASLSTLPPNTCNTESLGSASALLSSIAKSAWTVTTAMASAAKAKVVPTPKASDKNPPRLRRSPETLPLTGKTAGDRDKGNPTTDTSYQQIRTVTGLAAAKDTFKTSFTDLIPNIAQPEVKDYESSPRGSFQSLPPHIVVTEAKEPMRNTAMPTLHAAVSAASGELPQVPLPINIPSSKLESGCRGAVPQTSSQEWPLLSSPLTPSFTGQFQSMPTLSCSRSQQAENQILHSVNIHSDVPQPQPSMSHEQQSPDANSVSKPPQEFLGCNPSAKALPRELQASDIKTASNVASDLTSVPMTKPVHFLQDRYNLPQGDTSEKALVTQKDEEPQQLKSKSGDQPRSTVITSPTETTSVKPEAHSKMAHVPADAVPTDPSSTNTASLYPPPLEPPKLVAFGEEDKPPGKLKSNFEHLKQSLEVDMQGQVQAQQQVGKIENDPPKASSTLASPEVSMSETDAPTVQTAHQLAADFTPRSTETTKQGYQFKDGQIQQLHIKAKTATSEFLAFESVQPQRDDVVARTDPRTESASEKPCESATQPESVLSLEETVSLKPNTPPESVFLNKPDQITNLVEEVIQLEPDKDVLFERSPSTLSAQSSQPSELSTSKANEPEHVEMKTEEFPVKPSDVKEHGKEGGMKLWRDLEGEFEPRRTRHSSEEVPGMSTRSLRSGRRSPGEAIARTKEKEESPPATRGRGQKKEEAGSEMDHDALSRKRSTRSSGRDMYYGPIISYKRRKTNQK